MSLRSELACASRALNAHVQRLPEEYRPDTAVLWRELMAEVNAARSEGTKIMTVIEWRQLIGERLSTTLAHAPLTEAGERRVADPTGR